MISRNRQFTRIALLLIFITSMSACTTTTTKLTKTEPRTDNASQLEKARQAYNQENYGEAAAILTPLAEQGDANAQYALGYLYHNGLGVPRNYKLALQWMTAASAKGNQKATEALRRISEIEGDVTDSNLKEEQASTESAPMEPIIISGRKTGPGDEPKAATTAVTTDHEPESKSTMAAKPEHESTEPVSVPEESKTSEPTSTPESQSGYSADEKWIMDQPKANYCIQLIATGNQSALMQFISENNLEKSAKYYKTRRNNKDWYTLIQGSYDSHAAATNAIKGLPSGLREMNPWIKSMADIQNTLSGR